VIGSVLSAGLAFAACGDHQGELEVPSLGSGGAIASSGGTAGESGEPMPSSGGSAGDVHHAPHPSGAGSPDEGPAERCVYHSPPVIFEAPAPEPEAEGDGGETGIEGAGEGGVSGASGGAGGAAGHEAGDPSAASGSGGTESDESTEVEAAAGAGGAGEPSPSITVQTSPFVGKYLADSRGIALYVYGVDFPGDCEYEPVSNCYNDCEIAWPIFNAQERTLAPELDDGDFGTIERADGTYQTTYRGWPLYYYKDDFEPGDVTGQGKGRIWHLAELELPNIVIMRVEQTRFLGDVDGKALYTYAGDTVGTAESPPVSACTGACRDAFEPYAPSTITPVSYLEPTLFGFFVSHDGIAQVAYRGAPLYRSKADVRSGQTNGLEFEGWSLAPPP